MKTKSFKIKLVEPDKVPESEWGSFKINLNQLSKKSQKHIKKLLK